MKRLLVLCASFLLLFSLAPEQSFAEEPVPPQTAASVIISEVKLGESLPAAQQPVREFITLFNPNDAEVMLDGWKLEYAKSTFSIAACQDPAWNGTGTSSKTLNGLRIAAGGTLSVGYEVPLGYSLTDDKSGALRLTQPVDSSFVVHDLVGWQSTSTEPAPCAENAAAPLPAKGESIQRYLDCDYSLPIDSNNNTADFFVTKQLAYGTLGGMLLPACKAGAENPPSQTLTCEGVMISEVLPNPAGTDSGHEFIELYNSTTDFVVLDGCGLQVNSGTIYRFAGNLALAPGTYRAFYDTGLTLPNAAGGTLYLLSPTAEELDTVTYQADLADDVSWAWFGTGEWEATYAPAPNALNVRQPTKPCPAGQVRSEETSQCRTVGASVSTLKPCSPGQQRNPETNRCRKVAGSQFKPCRPGQVRNPETNRCRSLASTTSTLVPCKPDQERNPATNRCRKIAGASTLKPCAAGQERNPETNRCRKIAGANTASLPDIHDIQAVNEGNALRWWIAGGAVAIVAAYCIYEWRRDIASLFAKIKHSSSR